MSTSGVVSPVAVNRPETAEHGDTTRSERAHPGLLAAAEAALSVLAAAVLVLLSVSVDVNPLTRIGQVSGLAGIGLRFAVLGVLVLAAVALSSQFASGNRARTVLRLGCAAVAGLGTGIVAGGVVVALRGTSLPLFAHNGDIGTIASWAESITGGHSTMSVVYPPAVPHLVAWWSAMSGATVSTTLKHFEIAGTALCGPAAYLSWRLLCRPVPALAIGAVTMLPLLNPYKPYESIVLIVLIPLLAKTLTLLASSPYQTMRRLVPACGGLGLAFAALFLVYSGWFLWAALGTLVAAAIMFPWRRPLRGLLALGTTSVVFVLASSAYLVPLLSNWSSPKNRDSYFAFDSFVDPAYIAMWRTDLPGHVPWWPPPGELGGVGVFTLLLVVGLGTAIALGRHNPIVITAACGFGGAWLVRLYYASQMYADENVRLYPRTSAFLLYCLLILTVMAGYLVLQRFRNRGREPFAADAPVHAHGVSATGPALLAAMLFLLGSAGSATADRYMPSNDNSLGKLAWTAHTERAPNGHCSAYLQPDCKTVRRAHSPHRVPVVLSPNTAKPSN